jgi:hypothetical protein
MDDYAKAEPLFQRALKIKQKALGPTPEPSATSSPDYTDWDVERGVEDQERTDQERSAEARRAAQQSAETRKDQARIESARHAKEAVPEFPWPPPRASASDTISRELLLGSQEHLLLGDAVAALDLAFRKAGYGERSYYGVPGGFAMVSRMEQMNQDGTAKGPPDRWSLKIPPMGLSLSAYLKALFRGRPGYYRIIVFVVTSEPFSQSGAKTTSKEAGLWVSSGLNALPKDIASRDYTSDHRCTALIYEFKRTGTQGAEFVDPSEITGQIHLEKSGLLTALKKR